MLATVSIDFDFEKDYILGYTDIEIFEKDFINYLSTFENGIGLSANQIGVLKRFFVIGYSRFDNFKEPTVVWNPSITWVSKKANKMAEGCLSFPDTELSILRPWAIRARWQDSKGKVSYLEMKGLEARCFMHELDHLNGITFDRIRPVDFS